MQRPILLTALLMLTIACPVQRRGGGPSQNNGGSSSSADTGDVSDGFQSADMEGDARCYDKELRNDGVDRTPFLNDYLDPFQVQGTTGLGQTLSMRVTHDWTAAWTPYALHFEGECWDARTVHVFMGIEDNESSDYAWFSADVYAIPSSSGVVGLANAVRIEQSDWPWAFGEVEAGSTGTMAMTMTSDTVTISVRGTDGVQWLTIEAPRP